jgi:hypothetical protein
MFLDFKEQLVASRDASYMCSIMAPGRGSVCHVPGTSRPISAVA